MLNSLWLVTHKWAQIKFSIFANVYQENNSIIFLVFFLSYQLLMFSV